MEETIAIESDEFSQELEKEIASEKSEPENHNKFSDWLSSSHTALISLVTLFITTIANGIALVLKFDSIVKVAKPDNGREIYTILFYINYALQLIVLLSIFFYYSRLTKPKRINWYRSAKYINTLFPRRYLHKGFCDDLDTNVHRIGQLNLMVFNTYWRRFWGSMLVLYFFFLIQKFGDNGGDNNVPDLFSTFLNCASNFVNNIGAICIFMCFLVMQNPIQWREKSFLISEQRYKLHSNFFPLFIGCSLVFLIQFLTVRYVLNVTGIDNKVKLASYAKINTWFDILSGVINCTAMVMFTARLDSKFMNVKSFLILVIYLYAAIQPLYGFFPHESVIKLIILYSALFLKVHFFLIVAYIINTGRLSDYLIVFPYLDNFVSNEIWGKKSTKDKKQK